MRQSLGRATASWSGEELQVTFSASLEETDFGVPGSPIWDEASNVLVDSMSILGIACDFEALPKPVQDSIMALADEVEWLN